MPSIKIGVTALIALSLDDSAMQHDRGVDHVEWNARIATIGGNLGAIALVLDDLFDRGNSGGWDQPKEWERACRRAFDSAKKQLEALGYVVRQERDSKWGVVTIKLDEPPSPFVSDFDFQNHGSVWLVVPTNDAARDHLKAHTDGTWFGNGLAVEPRYIESLVESLEADGFSTATL